MSTTHGIHQRIPLGSGRSVKEIDQERSSIWLKNLTRKDLPYGSMNRPLNDGANRAHYSLSRDTPSSSFPLIKSSPHSTLNLVTRMVN